MNEVFLIIAICSLLAVIFLVLKSVFRAVKPYLLQLIRFIKIRPYLKRICIISLICILSFIGFYATKEQPKPPVDNRAVTNSRPKPITDPSMSREEQQEAIENRWRQKIKDGDIGLKEHGPGWNNSDEFNEVQKQAPTTKEETKGHMTPEEVEALHNKLLRDSVNPETAWYPYNPAFNNSDEFNEVEE